MSESSQRRVGGSRRPLHRIHVIHETIREGGYPNCRKLAEMLEVTDKTIQRDISFMRDELGMPLEYDGRMHGYTYSEMVEECPVHALGAREIAGYLLARQAMGAVRGTAIEQTMRGLFGRLNRMVEQQLGVSRDDLEHAVSRRVSGAASMNPEAFGQLASAVLRQCEVRFHYHKLAAERPEPRRIRPYHLGEVEGCWYVIGHDLGRDSLRTFALPRISRVVVESTPFTRPPDFDGEAFLQRSFGVWTSEGEQPPQVVRVRLRGYAARMARERRWHPTQEVRAVDDAGQQVEVTFRLSRPEELMRWVLGWGSKATVIEPDSLRQRIRTELRRMQE